MGKGIVGIGLGAALLCTFFLLPFSSPSPDGLERVARDMKFEEVYRKAAFRPLIPDYAIPGLKDKRAAGALGGAAGTLVVFVCAFVVGRGIKRNN